MMTKNILIIDGYSTGRFFPQLIRQRGMVPYHLTSGMEKNSNLPADLLSKYIQSQIGNDYKETYQMPDSLDEILPLLQKIGFTAVIPGTESGVELAEELAHKLGIPGNPLTENNIRRDKYLMQKALEKAGLRSIPALLSGNVDEIVEWCAQLGGKVVLKPVKSAGTDGVCVCNSAKEVAAHAAALLGTRDAYGNINNKILAEKYIEGREIVVNCVSYNGKHIVTDVWDYNKILLSKKFPIYDAFHLKTRLNKEYKQAVQYTIAALDALNIRYGATHSELMLTDEGPVLIETAARLMGLITQASNEALGYNVPEWTLDSYIDEAAHLRHAQQPYAPRKACIIKTFLSFKDGGLKNLEAVSTLPLFKTCKHFIFDHTLQTNQLHRTVNMVTRPGECTFVGDAKDVLKDYETARLVEALAPKLFFQYQGDGPLTPFEEKILLQLKKGNFPAKDVQHFFNGYPISYKTNGNSHLHVLKANMQPISTGETGDVYLAGEAIDSAFYTADAAQKEDFIPNPFYSTVRPEKVSKWLLNLHKQALLDANGQLFFIQHRSGDLIPAIQKVKRQETWPLSFIERQMTTEYMLNPLSNAYNARVAFKLSGPLDVTRLGKALRVWINENRIFRSYYPQEAEGFVHRIADNPPVHLQVVTCLLEQVDELMEKSNLPYDLTKAPLYRFHLYQISPQEHVFVIGMHHAVIDGITIINSTQELWALYENLVPKKRPAEAVDYLDYAVWEKKYAPLQRTQKVFLDMFKDGVPENEMPVRSTRPEVLPQASNLTKEQSLDISLVKEACAKFGVSPSVLIIAALSLTVAKYCDSEDIVLGNVMHGRNHPQTKTIVGMFANLIPLRFLPQKKKSLAQYIAEVSKLIVLAKENQNCPLDALTPALAPARNLSRHPIFDVVINYRNDTPAVQRANLTIAPWQVRQATAIDLQVEVIRNKKGLTLDISYSDQVYHPEVVESMASLLNSILMRFAQENSEKKTLAELSEIALEEKKKILTEFAGEQIETQLEIPFVARFEKTVNKFPKLNALTYQDQHFTYEELDRISGILASLLIEKGLKPNDRVGLLLKRSEMLCISILGVLKAGGVCVPMDVSYPAERLEFMLKDSQAKVLFADEELLSLFQARPALGVITSTQVKEAYTKKAEAFCGLIPRTPQEEAVVLFTSGTTGNPKGVLLTQGNIVNLIAWVRHCFSLSSDSNIASCAGFGFDAFLMDTFPTLATGGTLFIISEDMRLDLPRLAEYFEQHQITNVVMTTQLGRKFVQNVPCKSLKTLVVGGETLLPVAPPKNYKLYNMYGPSECTVCVTYFVVDKLYDRVPLGKALPTVSIYILDNENKMLPIGAFGELCVAGPQVGSGYLNRPDLTEKSFIKNPFTTAPAYRTIYKTGDIARFLPDGNIDFLGRRDTQIKIRGFRIELSEIELCIRQYPGIQDAVVVAHKASNKDLSLVAYFVAQTAIPPADVKRFMEDKLPPYMIPSFIIQIERIPANPNGKVDRRALPKPSDLSMTQRTYLPPKNRTEKEVALIWAEVLDIDITKIGREDHFFQIGGTSLRATEVSLQYRRKLGVNISPASIFKYPLLKQQARMLDEHNQFPMVHIFNAQGPKTPLFFIHTANTGAEAYAPLAALLPKDQPFYAVEPHNLFSEQEQIRGIPNLAKQYIEYMRKVAPQGPYRLGGWSFGALIAYEIARQLEVQGEQVEMLYLLDPVVRHNEEHKKLEMKLMGSSYFLGYLNNDPLFGKFKKMGLIERLHKNSVAVAEDMHSYELSDYTGKTILFKATRRSPIPKETPRDLAKDILKFQTIQQNKKHNGFEKYVKNLKVVTVDCIHDYMMRGTALEKIAAVVSRQDKK